MDEQRITGAGDSERDRGGSSGVGLHPDRVTTVEQWSPPSDGNATATVRRYLTPGESLRLIDPVAHLNRGGRPAVVGLTDERLMLVGEDGGFVGVGLDRISAVRSEPRTAFDVRGLDYRLVILAGYVLAIVGLVGVLGSAANPLTPTFALVTLGAVLAADHVRRQGADLDALLETVADHDRDTGLADRLRLVKRRINRHQTDEEFALAATGGFAVATFVLVIALEGGAVAPVFTLFVVGGAWLAVYAFYNSETHDGMELVRVRQQTITAMVDDGSSISVRTRPDSTLARELARLGGTAGSPRRGNEASS